MLNPSGGSFTGVITNETLTGNGTSAYPLGVSESALAPSEAEIYVQTNSGDLNEVSGVVQSNSANWNLISGISGAYVPLTAHSCTIGYNNSAGSPAFAQGTFNNAGGPQSFAQGHNNIAGGHCLAQGVENSANNDGFAQGEENYAQEYAFSQGYSNSAENRSFAQGISNSAYLNSFVQGWVNRASGTSLAQGNENSAYSQSFAQGQYNSAYDGSLAQGKWNSAYSHSFAQGSMNYSENHALTQGGDNTAKYFSQALGFGLSIQGSRGHEDGTDYISGGLAIGTYNQTSSNVAFVIGNGHSNGASVEPTRSDSFIIYPDGSVSAAGKISANGVELGGGGVTGEFVPQSAFDELKQSYEVLSASYVALSSLFATYSGQWLLPNEGEE